MGILLERGEEGWLAMREERLDGGGGVWWWWQRRSSPMGLVGTEMVGGRHEEGVEAAAVG